MNFTVTTIARSLAAHLAPVLPGVQMLEDPAQQGVEPPCMFLQQRYSNIKPHPGGRWLRTIGVDLTYLLDYNLPDLQQQYSAAAETLDLCMEVFPYTDGTDTALLRAYDRKTDIDSDGLHYKFELRIFVEKPEDAVKMQTLSIDQKCEISAGLSGCGTEQTVLHPRRGAGRCERFLEGVTRYGSRWNLYRTKQSPAGRLLSLPV